MEKILVMEDDESIKSELTKLLNANGYMTVDNPPCDLALLDIQLPQKSGYEICRELRMTSDIPIIFLTAKTTAEDELIGFGVGADDYIRKPYNSSVLLARISRLLKRKNTSLAEVRGLKVNFDDMTVSYGEKSAPLTKNETKILSCLFSKEVCARDEIVEKLWNESIYIDENTLYVNVNRLKAKIKSLGAEGFISTVRGVGYRL